MANSVQVPSGNVNKGHPDLVPLILGSCAPVPVPILVRPRSVATLRQCCCHYPYPQSSTSFAAFGSLVLLTAGQVAVKLCLEKYGSR